MIFAGYPLTALLMVGGIYLCASSQAWDGDSAPPPQAQARSGERATGAQVELPQRRWPAEHAAQRRTLRGRGKVYFVPVGSFPSDLLQRLVAYYREKYGMVIETLAELSVDPTAFDEARDQLVAEGLIALVKRGHPQLARNPNAILIGLTRGDMYIRRYTWQFAFAYRDGSRFAVVSTGRMDPVNFDEDPDAQLLETRLRKMVTKQIGIMHFGLSQSNDRNSVMYGPILGLDDLDSVGEEF